MQVLIPMAGKSQRFLDKGYSTLKSLIVIEGKTVIEHIVEKFSPKDEYIFICSSEALKNTDLKSILLKLKPSAKILEIEGHKKGPVYSVSLLFDEIKDDEPVILNYCDFNWSWNYNTFLNFVEDNKCDGCIIGYTGFHPHLLRGQLYAGVRVDKDWKALEIKEKHRFTEDPMHTFHSSGTYYFRTGAIMKKYFKELLDKDMAVNSEYYASTPYELMIKDGLRVYTYPVEHFMQWGTPEDMEEYLKWSDAFSKGNASELAVDDNTKKSHDYWSAHFNKTKTNNQHRG
jgi:NDP-sugar pyrophosphorylase family protein